MTCRILIVEDNVIWQQRYKKWLGEDYDYEVTGSTDEARQIFESFKPDIVVQDLGLPQIEQGFTILDFIIARGTDAKIIVITSSKDHQHALEAQKRGAYSYFFKGENIQDELPLLVKRAIRMQKLERENRQLRLRLSSDIDPEEFVAVSKPMKNILTLVENTKDTQEPILITGESGTGKEVIARHIHNRGKRSKGPFIAINSAALPDNLLENELFGHEKGAFTGATDLKKGHFELAAGGTLFLDEIGEMPMSIQAKLLRVLQEKRFYRLGGTREIKADFRLVAATNRNLKDEVKEKNFREDLFYRINVIPINVPPLRERPDDIPALIDHFSSRYCERNNKQVPRFDPSLIAYLSKQEWRGNIRELENTLIRLLLTNNKVLTIKDIQGELHEQDDNPVLQYALSNNLTLEEFQRMYVRLVYDHVQKNKKEACKYLNINYRTLVSRLE